MPTCMSSDLSRSAASVGLARRAFLRDAFCGFGSLALASLWRSGRCLAASNAASPAASAAGHPLAAKLPPAAAKAKSVIFLFMAGGPSHIDSFDPKPLLNQLDGQKKPEEFGEAKY